MTSFYIHLVPLCATLLTGVVCYLLKHNGAKFCFDFTRRKAEINKGIALVASVSVVSIWHFLVLFRHFFPMDHSTILIEILLLMYVVFQGYFVFLFVFIPTGTFINGSDDERASLRRTNESLMMLEDRRELEQQTLEERLASLRGSDSQFDGTHITLQTPINRRDLLRNILRFSSISLNGENLRTLNGLAHQDSESEV